MCFWRQRSSASDQVYDQCGWCGRETRFGNAVVTVNLNVERASELAGVEVIKGELARILCESCGGDLDAGALRRVLDAQRSV